MLLDANSTSGVGRWERDRGVVYRRVVREYLEDPDYIID
jgi:hypothetical protein